MGTTALLPRARPPLRPPFCSPLFLLSSRPQPLPCAAYTLPKLYQKTYYCVSCAVHSRIVRVRNVFKRRNRDPPVRFKRTPEKTGAK